MYSLFEIMTLEGWDQVGRPLVREEPAMAVFLFLFIMVFTFGLLNMIVAMVVEKTLLHQRKMDEHVQELTHEELELELLGMKHSFDNADAEHLGYLTLEAFQSHLNDDESMIVTALRKAGAPTDDPAALFSILDQDLDGHLSYEEVLAGCARIHGGSFDVLALKADVRKLHRQLNKLRDDIRYGTDHHRLRNSACSMMARTTSEASSRVSARPAPPPPVVKDVPPPVSCAPEITVVKDKDLVVSSFVDSPIRRQHMPGTPEHSDIQNGVPAAYGYYESVSSEFDPSGSRSGSPPASMAVTGMQIDILPRRSDVNASEDQRYEAQQTLLQEVLSAQKQILQRIESVDEKQADIIRRVTSVEDTLTNWIGTGV
jgi:hypothetical protein